MRTSIDNKHGFMTHAFFCSLIENTGIADVKASIDAKICLFETHHGLFLLVVLIFITCSAF
jgi:hypothetical protein